MSEEHRYRDLKQLYDADQEICGYRARALEESVFDGAAGMEAAYRVAWVREPLVVSVGGRKIVMSDRGYAWYHFAPKERYFWLSAAFTPELELLEMYFDITAGSSFEDPENPCFRDMYLDMALTPDGSIRVLDRDELDAAAEAGIITADEYRAAIRHGEELLALLQQNGREWINYCSQAVRRLLTADEAENGANSGEGSLSGSEELQE